MGSFGNCCWGGVVIGLVTLLVTIGRAWRGPMR